jgi:hypothetical protein
MVAAGLLFLNVVGVAGVASASPAAAANPWCTQKDWGWVDSGVSYASIYVYHCADGANQWYRITGTLWDDSCDNRTAYLDIYDWPGASPVQASGCGASTPYQFDNYRYIPYAYTDVRTRACNASCSSSDWDTVSAYGY